MEQQEIFEKFTWKVENFSCLNMKVYEYFVLGGYPWRICLNPKKNIYDCFGIYLEAVKTGNMSEGWTRDVKFKLVLFNQLYPSRRIINEYRHEFNEINEKEKDKCVSDFKRIRDFRNPKNGFIVNDACIVGVELFVCKSSHEKQIYQTVNLTSSLKFGSQIALMEVESPLPVSVDPTKNSAAEFVFAGLRKVLYFLQTRKVKDMSQRACKELRVLWDEIEKFKFDLTWLKPHVQYALGMESFVEKAKELEKLSDTLVVLELETMRIKEKMISAEISFNVEKELLKAKGVEEIGLNNDLGCGNWKG